jgi:hypothetical protein
MSAYDRAVRGAEAGAIAAAALEGSFFLLDAVRLTPLATPLALSGVVPTAGGLYLDLTSVSGVLAILWAFYQVLMLTVVHLITFGSVGVLAAVFIDWSEPMRPGRVAIVALLCTLAFYLTVSVSGPVVLGTVGWPLVIAMNLGAALILAGCLRLVSAPKAEVAATS